MNGSATRGSRTAHLAGALAAAVIVAAAVVLLVGGGGAGANSSRTARRHWPPVSLVNLTRLMAMGGQPAPPLELIDQRGQRVSMSQFRGRVVVVEAMDPKCTDVCPIVSEQFIDAVRDLGTRASRVVFVAINVNQFHERAADVMAFSHEHRLDRLANWCFLTGSTAALKRAWREYGIVVKPNPTGDVVHSDLMYFLDPQGREQWLAAPNHDKATIPQWGEAIAQVVRDLA